MIDEAKALALAYLDSIPAADRVLLIEADGAPSVRVPFTLDRQRLRGAILSAEPGWTALDLGAAFDLAAGTLRLALRAEGERLPEGSGRSEVVYIGPGRLPAQPALSGDLTQVRFLETGAPSDSLGLLAFRATAGTAEPGQWDVELVARNYGQDDSRFRLDFFFDEKLLGHRELAVPAGGDSELRFTLRTKRPGRLVARSAEADAFAGNNEATIEIPHVRRTRLQVVGGSEHAFEPLLASGAHVDPSFVESSDDLTDDAIHVWASGGDADDSRRAIYLAPPGTASPVPASRSIRDVAIDEWSPSHPLAHGVRDRDLMPRRARVFEAREGDEIIAGTSEGPVVLARTDGDRRMVAFGFDLAGDSVRGQTGGPAPVCERRVVAGLGSISLRVCPKRARRARLRSRLRTRLPSRSPCVPATEPRFRGCWQRAASGSMPGGRGRIGCARRSGISRCS